MGSTIALIRRSLADLLIRFVGNIFSNNAPGVVSRIYFYGFTRFASGNAYRAARSHLLSAKGPRLTKSCVHDADPDTSFSARSFSSIGISSLSHKAFLVFVAI